MKKNVTVFGKIILSGEYAVTFGLPGLAIPASVALTATFEEFDAADISIESNDLVHPLWNEYIQKILHVFGAEKNIPGGKISIESSIPPGKGMGSSTALVIALTKIFFGNDEKLARHIEDVLAPGNSGIDFEVIWNQKPMLIESKRATSVQLDTSFLKNGLLIDTGLPNETTSELVAWVKDQKAGLDEPLHAIGHCTQDFLVGKDPFSIVRRHHKAQIALGVVPESTRNIIEKIETRGGAAKVIGAGGRTGGGGMVLALHEDRNTLERLVDYSYPVILL